MLRITIICSLFAVACTGPRAVRSTTEGAGLFNWQLVDPNATSETKALFHNLKILSLDHTLFGHQHATEYGHGWAGDADRSDVKSVTGSHPAVIGVDLSRFTGGSASETRSAQDELRKNVADTYNRGGVTTVAWHFMNPVSG